MAGTDNWQDCRVPDTVFARGLSIAAVIWAIDSGLVTIEERDLAQGVLEELWLAGPIRPELIGAPSSSAWWARSPTSASAVGRAPRCARANAGFALPDGAISRPALPDLVWTVSSPRSAAPAAECARPSLRATPWVPRRGARVRCRECGRLGTVLGVDADDGWTVIEHHPPVVQREDGMWEVQPAPDTGPRQCRGTSRASRPPRSSTTGSAPGPDGSAAGPGGSRPVLAVRGRFWLRVLGRVLRPAAR